MASRRSFDSLSDAYRRRLERGGIGRTQYERGDSLKAARGHKAGVTPEHPSDVKNNSREYGRYMSDRANRMDKQRQKAGISDADYKDLIERALRNGVKILESVNVNFNRAEIRRNLRKLPLVELREAAAIDAATWRRNATSGKSAGAYRYGKKSTKRS